MAVGLLITYNVQRTTNQNYQSETKSRNPIYQRRTNIHPRYLICEILNERIWQILFTELSLHLPLPIGYRAIAEPKPEAQNNPGKDSSHHQVEVEFSGRPPDPAEEVKPDD